MHRAALFFVLVATGAAIPALAADQWTRITTPNFELYTTAGEKRGKETVRRFEQVREFFLKASPVRSSSDFPVRIVEFETGEQYQPFRPPATVASAYFLSTPTRDYIVLGNQALSDDSLAIHEYMHLIIRHSGLKIPIWLNEGWADVYSTLRPTGKETAVGDLREDRMNSLKTDKWLSFDELTSTDQNSPNYHEGSRVGIFYAESWALTHMLYLSPEYKDTFGKFVIALHRGSSAAEAIRIAFNRTPEDVYKDLRAYFDRKKIYGRVFKAGSDGRESEPGVTPVPAFDSSLMLADLLTTIHKLPEAKQEYARLELEQPTRPDLALSIGTLALGEKDFARARTYFDKAFSEGEADPQMCLQLAMLDAMANERIEKIIPILERAVKGKPDYTEARIRLGLARLDARDYVGAISTLMAIPEVAPDRAAAVFCGLGFARVEAGDLATARQNADDCSKWAKADSETSMAARLRKLLDARSQPAAAVHMGEKLQRIAGTVRGIACAPEGNRLQIIVGTNAGNKAVVFDLPAAAAVELSRMPQGYTMTCGALKPVNVVVEYAPPRSVMETSIGIVRRIDFPNPGAPNQ
jgi:tetratricopeptide (TPR) repeat protein